MSSGGGYRSVEDEKRLLTELGRLFHVAKANHKETQNQTGTSATTAQDKAKAAKPQPQQTRAGKKKSATRDAKAKARRGSQRRSKHGGSIWIVLKGGFSAKTVPLSTNVKKVEARAEARARRSEQARLAALEMAEAYVQSAWANAQEANLAVRDATTGQLVPTAEGESYVREQYAIAARMLRPSPAGAQLRAVITNATSAAAAGVSSSSTPGAGAFSGAVSRASWESAITRERAILNYGMRATSDDADEKTRAEIESATAGYYFPLAEPVATAANTSTSAAQDVVPTKCIIRVSNSQRQRHTAVLSSVKAVNYVKANFMAVLRKELSGSKLPRGAEETVDGHEEHAAVVSGGKGAQKQQQQSSNNARGGKGGKSKKK